MQTLTKKILLVDDSNTALMMERMILKSTPHEVVTASNGRQALEVAREQLPDLILLDIVMPEMDGFETCRRLRSEPATQQIPIIMVTTRGEEHHIQAGYAAGCTDYVTKPVDSIELLSKVETLLGEPVGEQP